MSLRSQRLQTLRGLTLLACLLPALRAAHIQPATAPRSE